MEPVCGSTPGPRALRRCTTAADLVPTFRACRSRSNFFGQERSLPLWLSASGSVSKHAKAGGAAGPGTISSASSQGADAVRDGAVGPERFLRAGHYSLEVAAAAILAPVRICGLRRRDGSVGERGDVRRMRLRV